MHAPRSLARLTTLAALALAPLAAIAQPAGPEFRVNTFTSSFQETPSVSSSPGGGFVVVWTSSAQDGSDTGIFGRRYAMSGAPLAAEFPVNSHTTGLQGMPAVAVGPAGFVAVWAGDFGSTAPSIVARRFSTAGAALTPDFRVNDTTTSSAYSPRVAVDPSGDFVVVWSGYVPGKSWDIFGQRFAGTGERLGGQFRVNAHPDYYQTNPVVARNTSGDFVVAWQSYEQDGLQFGIYAQRYAKSGEPLGTEFRVNTTTSSSEAYPAITFDSAGRFIVVWQGLQDATDSLAIFGQRYAGDGTPLGAQFRVNAVTANHQSHPAIASDAGGGFLVSWQTQLPDAAEYEIFARAFRGSGAAAGSDFRVNSFTTSYQVAPSISSDAKGNVVVAWHSNGQDGSSTGVFAQRFMPTLLKGDTNADGVVDVLDVFYLINALFAQGPSPMGWSDANADGAVDVLDVFYVINYLFAAGPPPS